MGTITDRFHEANFTAKIKQKRAPAKYLVEIESTGEIVVGVIYDYKLYIQKIVQGTVIWTPVNEQCTLMKNIDGIL